MSLLKNKKIYEQQFDGEEVVEEFLQREEIFDQKGRLLQTIIYSEIGEVISYEDRMYELGDLIKVVTKSESPGDNSMLEERWSKQVMIESTQWYNEMQYLKTIFEYNSDKQLLRQYTVDEEGNSHGEILFQYTRGEILEEEFDENNILVRRAVSTLDQHENPILISTQVFGEDEIVEDIRIIEYKDRESVSNLTIHQYGKLAFESINTYNDQNELIENLEIDHFGEKKIRTRFQSDEKRLTDREEVEINEELSQVTISKYDEAGESIEERYYDKFDNPYFALSGNRTAIEYWPSF